VHPDKGTRIIRIDKPRAHIFILFGK